MRRLTGLVVVFAAACSGQSGSVRNAVGTASSLSNVLAPQMLAKVDSPFIGFFIGDFGLQTPPPPAVTHVQIRPGGAVAPITMNVATDGSFVVPAGIPLGSAQVLWRLDGQPWQSFNVTVAPANFELARMATGGQALATATGKAIGLATPAMPGQTISLTGSGLGYGTTVSAAIGGVAATVVYAGRGNPAGYDLIQVQVPQGVADSCYVPLGLQVGTMSVMSSISVTRDGSPCPHPFGLSVSDLKTLDAQGSVWVGGVSMSTSLRVPLVSAAHREENAGMSVSAWKAQDFAGLLSSQVVSGTSCGTTSDVIAVPYRIGVIFVPVPVKPPDVGKTVLLQNGNTVLPLTPPFPGFPTPLDSSLALVPAPVVGPGKWTWSTNGSADLAAASFSFTLPAPLQLAATQPVSLRRDQDQTVQWNGASFDAASTVTLALNGLAGDGVTAKSVRCSAPATAGKMTVPANLLGQFGGPSLGSIVMGVNQAIPGAVLTTKGGETVVLFVRYSSDDSRPVDFQ